MGVLAYQRGSNASEPTFLSDEEWQALSGAGTWVRAHEHYNPDSLKERRMERQGYHPHAALPERPQNPSDAAREHNITEAERQRADAQRLNAEATEHDQAAEQLRSHAQACLEEAQIYSKLADAVLDLPADTPSNPMPRGLDEAYGQHNSRLFRDKTDVWDDGHEARQKEGANERNCAPGRIRMRDPDEPPDHDFEPKDDGFLNSGGEPI